MILALAGSVMPDAVTTMRAEAPDNPAHCQRPDNPVDRRRTRLDLGLICPISQYPNISMLFAGSAHYVCLMPVEHPLAKARKPMDLFLLTRMSSSL